MLSPIIFFEDKDLVITEKPCGFNTHAQDENHPGFCEVLSTHLGLKLFVIHRLDRDTSGIIVFAKNKEKAKELSDLFLTHAVEKDYLFVSHQLAAAPEFYVSGEIVEEKKMFKLIDGLISAEKPKAFKSLTHFQLVDAKKKLYKASPLTGKSHQIRLHAEFAKIPLLGDTLHGGIPFQRLMLHAHKLKIAGHQTQSEFKELDVLKSESMTLKETLEFAYINKSRFIKINENSSYRLYHLQDHTEQVLADIYNQVLWVYWYKTEDPEAADLKDCEEFCKAHNLKSYYVRKMLNRGADPQSQQLWKSEAAPKNWNITEHKVIYELREQQGLSPGLFLDQSDQRLWTLQNSKNKKVLNFFSYTCGFSLCAALGKAESVTSVDVSGAFLEWGKKNFTLNHLDPKNYEFFKQDIFLFIKGAKNRKRFFDLIICDPPSFGRSQESVWKIEKDLKTLLQEINGLLKPQGQLLLTCNYEVWKHEDLLDIIHGALKNQFEVVTRLRSGLDFEAPQSETLLKGYLLRKK